MAYSAVNIIAIVLLGQITNTTLKARGVGNHFKAFVLNVQGQQTCSAQIIPSNLSHDSFRQKLHTAH